MTGLYAYLFTHTHTRIYIYIYDVLRYFSPIRGQAIIKWNDCFVDIVVVGDYVGNSAYGFGIVGLEIFSNAECMEYPIRSEWRIYASFHSVMKSMPCGLFINSTNEYLLSIRPTWMNVHKISIKNIHFLSTTFVSNCSPWNCKHVL